MLSADSHKILEDAATETILESISDGVFSVDIEWRIQSFNRAAETITGISRDQAIGQSCSDVFRSSMCEGACVLAQTLKTGRPIINHSCYIVNAEGERIPISVSTAVLRDKNGKIIGGAETFRDLSEVEALRQELGKQFRMGDFISRSPAMRRIFDLVPALADSASSVLIEGETGTGKEVMARAIHGYGERAQLPFIALNCGALPDSLLESELFGYKKGAFTGAERDKPGRFALAGNGTLFLDEIGDISPAMQVRLLRVLQERTYEPLGGVRSEKTEARILTATNRNLTADVRNGRFREDLFYRINVICLKIPPLRERKEDVPLLVKGAIARFNRVQNRDIAGITDDTLALLLAHDWPGNVRELENVLERAFIVCQGAWIEPAHLPDSLTGVRAQQTPSANINSVRKSAERKLILAALEQNGFSRVATARQLGVHKSTLYRKMEALDIALPTTDGRQQAKAAPSQ